MRTLVIHPNDRSTDFLSLIYKDKDYTVINSTNVGREALKEFIKNHDKIIMMGHGDYGGLYNPQTPYTKTVHGLLKKNYIIDDSFASLLKTKETISIWCYSDEYFRRHKISGFHTGMIISECAEQHYMFGEVVLNKDEQLKNMVQFATILGECIEKSPEEIKEYVLKNYTGDDMVTQFNRRNINVL